MRSKKFKYICVCLAVLVVIYFVGSRTTRYSIDRSEAVTAPTSEKSQPEQYAFGYQPALNYSETRAECDERAPLKQAYFGDLHIHTAVSSDAYPDGTRVFPDDAYRYALGNKISLPVPEGVQPKSAQLERPLDFASITDHAEGYGEGYICRNEGVYPGYNSKSCKSFRAGGQAGVRVFQIATAMMQPSRIDSVCGENNQDCAEAAGIVWADTIRSAEEVYDRTSECSFSSFVGYEYTRSTNNNHMHRNTIYKNASVPKQAASFVDFPSLQSLLTELETSCRQGIEQCDVISIPHNSNISGGNAFNPKALAGYSEASQQAHRQQRNSFDRLAEITQHKGSSECQNGFTDILSDDDEYCDYEAIRKIGQTDKAINLSTYIPRIYDVETKECGSEDLDPKDNIYKGYCLSSRDFLRGALLEGLQEQKHAHVNPFEFGIIASTDTHLGTPGQAEEATWQGHIADETTLEGRLGEAALGRNNRLVGNPGGLAGVWAVENSRDALFQSMKRREAFGTSGTRIAPRFFAGQYLPYLCQEPNWLETAYRDGTPMGSKLPPQEQPFQLLAQAHKDPHPRAKGLEKLQIIKGWLDQQGQKRIEVIDVATSKQASINGSEQLCAVYTDPEYDPSLSTYYYLRVVETPTARWSTAQCEALEISARPPGCENNAAKQTRELAWSSPIWFSH